MGDTQTSVRDVLPEVGGNFDLDQSVVDGKPLIRPRNAVDLTLQLFHHVHA